MSVLNDSSEEYIVLMCFPLAILRNSFGRCPGMLLTPFISWLATYFWGVFCQGVSPQEGQATAQTGHITHCDRDIKEMTGFWREGQTERDTMQLAPLPSSC